MITHSDVFDAVRRGYNELDGASNSDIINYFSAVDQSSVIGHTSNIKGILFEQEYVETLAAQGIDAELFEATNHPGTDISLFQDGFSVNEIQLKATDSVSYVSTTIAEYPDLAIVTTSEVAGAFDSSIVTDSGITDASLEQAVSETLFDDVVNPTSPLSIIGLFFGLPF